LEQHLTVVVFDDSGEDPDFQLDPVALSVPPPVSCPEWHRTHGKMTGPVCSGAWLFRRLTQALLLNPN